MPVINIDLDMGTMRPIVEAFQDLDYDQDYEIILHHRPNSRVRVEKYPLLCSIANEIRSRGHQCAVRLQNPNMCSQLNYAERMGFLSFLGIDYPYNLTKRAGGGRFIEVRNVNGYYYPQQELRIVFRNDFNFTEDETEDIATIISELATNCHLHSESSGGAILYCQKYPAQKNLNLFIVDSGVGICAAMQTHQKYQHLKELEVFKKSLEFGEGNGRGYGQGLFLVSEFIKRNFGYLRLITGNYIYLVQNGNASFANINTNYRGVILNLGIPFEINVTLEDIMNEQLNC